NGPVPPLYIIARRHAPGAPLFPYTTLFRSRRHHPRPRGRLGPAARRPATAAPDRRVHRHDHLPRRVHARAHRPRAHARGGGPHGDRKSTRLNSSHVKISYAVFCLKKKKTNT